MILQKHDWQNGRKNAAFTLIEMLVAITVFTIFIGFVMGAYLTFHRAQQDAAITRALMLEADQVLNAISEDIKERAIQFSAYEDEAGPMIDAQKLVLWDAATEHEIEYAWDEEEEAVTVQEFEYSDFGVREEADGYLEPLVLHSPIFDASFLEFKIAPYKNPYLPENILGADPDLWFQPLVQIRLTFRTPGHLKEEVVVDLKTSVASRLYQ